MTASDPRVDEIQARLDAATPGPWVARVRDGNPEWALVLSNEGEEDQTFVAQSDYDNDAEFIAAAPTDVAYLLAELRDRDEKLAKVNALAAHLDQHPPHRWASDAIRAAVAAAGGGES